LTLILPYYDEQTTREEGARRKAHLISAASARLIFPSVLNYSLEEEKKRLIDTTN
jgi:hypothetical protein